MAKRGLGKGLDALIPGGFQPEVSGGIQQVAIDMIFPNPSQPRVQFNDESLDELANSILEHGIIQPLILTPGKKADQYILIAGERRLRAAEKAGLDSVPAIIRDASDLERLELALIENIQRENLSPLESSFAYQKLTDEFSLSHDEIATKVGKSRSAITNSLRLLKLPQEIQASLHDGIISEGHARAILGLASKKSQLAAFDTINKNALNVRQTEELVRKMSGQKTAKKQTKKTTKPEIRSLEDNLRTMLGTKVSLKHSGKGGTIVIHYYSEEELDSLIERFKGI